VSLLQQPVKAAAIREAPNPPQPLFPCKWCERRFPSAARLRRHIRHAHTIRYEQVEARVLEQLEADRKQAEQHRIDDAAHNPDRLWDEWPGRWAADTGIDLVAETVEGGLWAIQAKAYDPGYAIKKADGFACHLTDGRPLVRLFVTWSSASGSGSGFEHESAAVS
jgi:Restriction endonuclease